MKNTISLKSSNEFQRVLKKGSWYSSDMLTLYILKKDSDLNYLGIAVGKKYSKSSVKRNRARRLTREAFRLLEDNIITGYEIVIVWKNSNSYDDANFENVSKDLAKCLKKANILKNKEDEDV